MTARRHATDYRALHRQPPPRPRLRRRVALCLLVPAALLICALGVGMIVMGGGGAIVHLFGPDYGTRSTYESPWWLLPGFACWWAGGALGNCALDELAE